MNGFVTGSRLGLVCALLFCVGVSSAGAIHTAGGPTGAPPERAQHVAAGGTGFADGHVVVNRTRTGPINVAVGEEVRAKAWVINKGERSGSLTVRLYVDGTVTDEERVTVAPDETETVEFTTTFEEPGIHTVGINDVPEAEINVSAATATPTSTPSPTATPAPTPTPTPTQMPTTAATETSTATPGQERTATSTPGTSRTVSAGTGDVETVTVDESAGGVTLETIGFRANETTTGTLEISASDAPLPGSPPFDVSPETAGLAYFSIDHSASNRAFENVTLTLSVDRDAVEAAGASPNEVAMYRYTEGEWVAQPTTLVDQTADTVQYRVTADGLSEWVAGTNRPDVHIADASVTVEASVGENADRARIDARITNEGDADGVYVARLHLENEVVDERRVTVPDGGTVKVTFDRSFEDVGRYTVTVNTVTAGVVQVAATGSVSVLDSRSDDAAATPTTTEASGPLLPVVGQVATIALLAVLFHRCRTRTG